MPFTPVIGISGYAGFRVLEKTTPRQREVFDRSPDLVRNIDYFRANIEKATNAEALVKDRKLLTVALGAFGLGEEIDKRALVQRIIESDPTDPKAIVNRLNDPRYKALTRAFDYGGLTGGANILSSNFREEIIARYKALEFERAVGDADPDFRLALNFKREIATIATGEAVDRVGWLQALGQLPVRTLLSKAFGLPEAIAKLDIDKQVEIFERRSNKLYGEKSPAIFNDPDTVDDVIRRFFLFTQIESGPSLTTPGGVALSLLQSSGISGVTAENLLLSQS